MLSDFFLARDLVDRAARGIGHDELDGLAGPWRGLTGRLGGGGGGGDGERRRDEGAAVEHVGSILGR